jgi:serine/threonine protein phosphatase 1
MNSKRILAIGDIHGCYKSLTTLAQYVSFSSDDLIVTIGDYIDRGPDSRSVIEWLIARKRELNLVPLRGNHELMMLAADKSDHHFREWISCGGDAALRSYGSFIRQGTLGDIPDSHWQFVKSCRAYYETKSYFFVHANAYPDISLEDQPDFMLYWEQFKDPPAHESGKVMICGHTPQRDGVPRNIGHAVCIDTWAHGRGWLTCLDVNSGQYWQTNESQETRKSFLGTKA